MTESEKRLPRWYFGGLASAGAVIFTHPLDLVKVHLQTQQKVEMGMFSMGVKVVRTDGFLGLYNGLSASILRQLTYSLTRFAIYDTVKGRILASNNNQPLPFYQKTLLAMFAGAIGGFVGTPADMVNVRMQNDIKVPVEQRRNYKHGIDGMYRVFKEEGVVRMWSGSSMAVGRAIFMTFGQVALYDQYKQLLIQSGYFGDTITTHFTSSFLAAVCATGITQPLDVMKTRLMNAPKGQFKQGIMDCIIFTAKSGPLGFFKGFIPAFIRLGPHTILLFIFFEQLRKNFGYKQEVQKS
ncbi:Mitochondrial dicarboxylate carrier [Holothuria leucospilota]|uniref:Mitochondrial dicarboxylate carrier n=1 Tax=Holothuria leucospilota TaxID=206669 RepID=A0A9Q1C4A9_HOLLE|nr:Mitochondrial dicarboxylate carrier [Holothuria leucospilota]